MTSNIPLVVKTGAGFATVFHFVQPGASLPVAAVVGLGAGFAITWASEDVSETLADPMLGLALGGATAEAMDGGRDRVLMAMLGGAGAAYAISKIDT